MIGALNNFGFMIPLINPPAAYQNNFFRLVAFRQGTTMAYTQKLQLKGVPITPGKFKNAAIRAQTGSTVSKSKVNDLILTFTTLNMIPVGGLLEIIVPEYFNIVVGTDYDYVLVM